MTECIRVFLWKGDAFSSSKEHRKTLDVPIGSKTIQIQDRPGYPTSYERHAGLGLN